MPRRPVGATARSVTPVSSGPSLQPVSNPNLYGGPALTALPEVVLRVHQGDDERWVFRLKRSNGTPFNLTGYTAACQFRPAVADIDTTPGINLVCQVTNPANGEIEMTLLSESSTLLIQSAYLWDLEITETTSDWTTTIVGGQVAVTKEVTRTL